MHLHSDLLMSFWRANGGKGETLQGNEKTDFSKVQSFQERMLSDNLQRPEAGPAGVSWLESGGSGNPVPNTCMKMQNAYMWAYAAYRTPEEYFQPGTAVL